MLLASAGSIDTVTAAADADDEGPPVMMPPLMGLLPESPELHADKASTVTSNPVSTPERALPEESKGFFNNMWSLF
jgi:hypothetical protein